MTLTTTAAPLLSVDSLSVSYGTVQAARNVSFDLDAGEAVAILGPNGAGKSSIARAISGVVRPAAGQVRLEGHDVAGMSAHEIRRRGVCYLPETRGIFPPLTVGENIRLATRLLPRKERDGAAQQAFEMFPRLADRRSQLAGSLSGGEQQMLALARVIACPPKVVIADELSLGLAPQIVEAVFERLLMLRTSGVAVVLIEQYVHRALEFAGHCVIMRRGENRWSGPTHGSQAKMIDLYLGGE
jgi:branched-chain amino acid transport system ATP-binding protein